MASGFPRILRLLITLPLLIAFLSACSDSNNNNGRGSQYEADIVWTEYGIPHITAKDWGGMGYGYAWAYAQHNYCVVMKAYVGAAGESARYFGEDGDLNEDLNYKMFNSDEVIAGIKDDLPEFAIDMLNGYAAGLNRYLDETGVENLAEGDAGCRGADWVREVTLDDTLRLIHKTMLIASSQEAVDFTVAVQPPEGLVKAMTAQEQETLLASIDPQALADAFPSVESEEIGSNAYAIGGDASQSSSGLLFGNPHFPWQGQLRFYMAHLTVGDEYDAIGASLHGMPMVLIGFNQNLAWSHTVSTGNPRFTIYELTLNPDNPLEYIYDGEIREFTTQTVTAEQKLADGTIETVEHTFYLSHFGPVIDAGSALPALGGWPNGFGTLLTYRDANFANVRGIEQWVRMGQSKDMGEFKENLRTIGIPWVNTIAADRYGDAFYGDISVNAHVTNSQREQCVRGTVQELVTGAFALAMDGSDSACEWGNDADTAEGVFGYDNLPKLETREYGANANDSYWLANPRQLLEGYASIIGSEGTQRSLRTRHTFHQAEMRLDGSDGMGDPGFNIDNLRQLSFQATNYAADLVMDDVIAICRSMDEDPLAGIALVEEACNVLAGWDRAHLVDSVGAHVFTEFWFALSGTPDLWATPFDPADPVNTPNDLNVGDPAVVAAVLDALEESVTVLTAAGIPLDRPWGEVQFDEKNGVRHGIHGGSGAMMFSVITSSLVDGEGYSAIRHGNSYMQAVTWDEGDCPNAFAILTYSQSTDPASPNYADSTATYSEGGWIDMAFCEADRDAAEVRRESVSQ